MNLSTTSVVVILGKSRRKLNSLRATGYLVVLLADGLVLVGEVGSAQGLSADVALHAVRVVELLVRLHRVALDGLLAHAALLNNFLED